MTGASGRTFMLATPLVALLTAGAAQGQSITKCQDAEGNWHYGDFAADACAEAATITEIDELGQKVGETGAVPTREELEAREAEEEQARLEAEERARQAAEDRRLLQTYDSAEAIVQARDKRLQAIDQEVESHRHFRQDLVKEKQKLQDDGNGEGAGALDEEIKLYDDAIQRLDQDRRDVMNEYGRELERYRELTE